MTSDKIFIFFLALVVCLVLIGAFAFVTGGFGLGKVTDIDEEELLKSFDPRKQFDDEV